ncbi:MAG: acetyl-CoA C-acyltransferase [Scardovia wiggsiae]|uniref:thiolase family protein n=1 Tax=Scardovia wiggsiae TaxID=230143 RepID=UPI001CAC727E|nr:acetyl-CoA C-acyltransferase [Scardovia wiggsiae]
MAEVVIVSAARTPIGTLNGSLSSATAVELGTIAAKAAIRRSGISASDIGQSIFGNVLQANNGQNIARQIALRAGMDTSSTAMTVNEVCGSGLKAVRMGQAAILLGDTDTVLVGGTESMSNTPYYATDMRSGHKYGSVEFVDGIFRDGLSDAFTGQPMGMTAENVAKTFGITRRQQDEFALKSHIKAVNAQLSGAFDEEIAPVPVPSGRTGGHSILVDKDDGPRDDTDMEKLGRLRTVFVKPGCAAAGCGGSGCGELGHGKNGRGEPGRGDSGFPDNAGTVQDIDIADPADAAQAQGTVTAGNASGINDGAAALVLMRKDLAIERGISYLAEISGYAEGGIDPDFMGYAPKRVIERMLRNTHSAIEDIDLFEINEAFASQSIAVMDQLEIPENKLNVNGGAIALGHPLGASGARILVTLLYALRTRKKATGVAALCVGGGIGVAMQIRMADGTDR